MAGERGKAIECLARIVGLTGLFFIVTRLARLLPPAFATVGIGALLAFFILMVASMIKNPMHGMILPLELLSTAGNILYYARIMAIGMALAVGLCALATAMAQSRIGASKPYLLAILMPRSIATQHITFEYTK